MAGTGAFLSHSRFSLSSDLIELITRVQETGLVLETTIAVANTVDEEIRSLNAHFKALSNSSNKTSSWLVTLSDNALPSRDHTESESSDSQLHDANSTEAFFTSISHDLRTPLNGLNGVLQLFGNTPLNPQQERYLQIAEATGKTLLAVTDDLLDLTKIDAGYYQLKYAPFSLHDVMNESVLELAPRAINKNLVLSTQISSSVPQLVTAGSSAISYIIKAFIENAIKYTEEGSVVASISCDRIERGEAQIKISVADTGKGISDGQVHDLQYLFNNSDLISTPKNGCARLGLTLCQRMLALTKGTFGIESTEGEGTVVSVTIPMRIELGDESAEERLNASLTGRKIMVIDTCPISLEYISGVLTPRNIQVDHFRHAQNAIDALTKAANTGAPYDLVLLEYNLPDMNGYEFAGSILENEVSPATKLVLLSTNDQILSSAEMKLRGFSASLTKPIRSSELVGALGKIFSTCPAAATHTTTTIYIADDNAAEQAARIAASTDNNQSTSYCRVSEKALLQDQALARDESHVSEVQSATDQDAPLILVVEDNPVNLLVAEETLLDAGYRVDIANHGEEAITRLERGGIDLVLMDCQMPVLDGFAATRRWRTMERENGVLVPRQLPIVALTANATKGDREKCLASGMNDYIAKPFQPETLFAVMNQYVRQPTSGGVDLDNEFLATGTG